MILYKEYIVTKMALPETQGNGAATDNQGLPAQPQPDQHWHLDYPYRVPTPKETSESKWEASCHCGRIHYFLSRDEPLNSKYCHCKDCQTMHAVSVSLDVPTSPHHKNKRSNASLRPPSNGLPLYTNLICALPTALKASRFTLPLCGNPSTICLARSIAPLVTRRSWTRGGTWSCCSRS